MRQQRSQQTPASQSLPRSRQAQRAVQSRGLGSLTSRILSGSVLGLGGGLIILAGGWVFTTATCLVAYQATQEFYGFITSKVGLWSAYKARHDRRI